MQATDDQVHRLEQMCYMPSLIGWWDTIRAKYAQFGFCDVMTDEQTIEEFDYIAKQLNRYISTHQREILENRDLDTMREVVTALHAKAEDAGKERKKLVYTSLRDDWLVGLILGIEGMMQEPGEEEENDWI